MYTNKTKGSEMLQHLREAARKLGIECLDTEWRGMSARYRLRCACGHEYQRGAAAILRHGRGCPECRNRARLARIHAAAQHNGGQCLETRYLGSGARYRLVCAKGHQWTALPERLINQGAWCKCCAAIQDRPLRTLKDGLARIQDAARAKGGVCLSTQYITMHARYTFRCAKGHEWEGTGDTVLQGTWCRQCANAQTGERSRLSDGLDRLRELARAKGGECLSLIYDTSTTRYHMRCAKGHEWRTEGTNIMRGSWCMQCFHDAMRGTIEEVHAIAHARGGRCLSTVYLSCKDKLTWECHRGHTWRAVPSSIKVGSWCPSCAPMNRITDSKSKARLKYLKKG